MEGYLGEEVLDIKDSPFNHYAKEDWVLYFIRCYGGFDGAHHKDWVLDQIARILKGSKIIIEEARWENGASELRVTVGEPTEEYRHWVAEGKDGEDGPDTYEYDEGIAP